MKPKPSRKRLAEFAFLVVLAVVWFFIGWIAHGYTQTSQPGAESALVEQVRRGLQAEYAGTLPADRDLSYGAIRGMLHRIDDSHLALLEPAVAQRFQADFDGQSGVIGLVPELKQGQLLVSVVFPGQPADQAGLKVGDVILSVDGVSMNDATSETEAALLIRGQVGQPARFVVRRGDRTLEFNPVRIERPIVTARMLDGNVAYIQQTTFTANSAQKMSVALQELLAKQPRALIWDLRQNGGGSMDAAQQILSFFIADGMLFTAELKNGQVRQFPALGKPLAPAIPLVVLIDAHTYSAAETSAIALRERGRATLVGETSHGKGTIQATVPLLDGSMLQYTVARWLSPNGTWIEGKGVPPDIAVTDDPATPADEILQAAQTRAAR